MTVSYLELPYQFDVTYITNIVNLIINKTIELANEHAIILPTEVEPYDRVDLVEIADAMRNVSSWQALVVSRIGLPSNLVPKIYEQVDYNSIGTMALYYGGTINNIIEAADNLTQQPPESYV
jgi:hypothetical protein